MTRQRFAKPKLYVDLFQYYKAIGLLDTNTFKKLAPGALTALDDELVLDRELFLSITGLSPRKNKNILNDFVYPEQLKYCKITYMLNKFTNSDGVIDNMPKINYMFDYIGFFGHNFNTQNISINSIKLIGLGSAANYFYPSNNNVNENMLYNGFTLITDLDFATNTSWVGNLTDPNDIVYLEIELFKNDVYFGSPIFLNSLSIGTTYTFPNTPELSVTMSRDYGTIQQRTIGGTILKDNTFKPYKWGNNPAWDLYTQNISQEASWNGRRSWSITFNTIMDEKLFNYYNGIYSEYDEEGNFNYDYEDFGLLNENTFFSKVLTPTMGGQLPFILQVDSTNYNTDQFAIVKIANNTLRFRQVAHNIYNISLTLVETS